MLFNRQGLVAIFRAFVVTPPIVLIELHIEIILRHAILLRRRAPSKIMKKVVLMILVQDAHLHRRIPAPVRPHRMRKGERQRVADVG